MTAQLVIKDVLAPTTCSRILDSLADASWLNGAETAGPVAASVKRNLQLASHSLEPIHQNLEQTITRHPMFLAHVRPRTVGLMVSRYLVDGYYGTHVDAATMGDVRRDVSFTLWLSDRKDYTGGDLMIDNGHDEDRFKLPAGSMVVYPATSLHRVEPVTSGMRTVVVGWARSYVRDAAKRELLYELDLAKSSLFAYHGKTPEVDLISKCSANLMRMWMED